MVYVSHCSIFKHLSLRPSQGITEFQIPLLFSILAYTLFTGPFRSSSWRPKFCYMCLIVPYTLHTDRPALAICESLFGYLFFFSIYVLHTALIVEHLSLRPYQGITESPITHLSSILHTRCTWGNGALAQRDQSFGICV